MKSIEVKVLDQKRFNALAGLSRSPAAAYIGEELGWYSNEDETVIGIVLLDTIDNDFAAVILVQDLSGRFRAFNVESSFTTLIEAREWVERLIKWYTGTNLKEFPQGDESGRTDLFKPLVSEERLHPDFIHLANDSAFLPAREIISRMMPHYFDVDGNFIEQFQTTGFDARLWELYIFAYISEEELFWDRTHPAPDFLVFKYGNTIAIEAVIVGRKDDNPPKYFKSLPKKMSPEEILKAHEGIIPIKFGSSLYSKLKKTYWELPHVKGKPLVFAIADFHDDQSMLWTSTALSNYLYGFRHEFDYDKNGKLVIKPIKILTHKAGKKEIPSGYFFQPLAEHVSAVLFSASGTLSKFNRIGRQAGFHDPKQIMIRLGMRYNHDLNSADPIKFQYIVNENCNETWAEGLSMFHSPNAIHPVPEELFPNVAHHHFRDGQIVSRIPEFHPYSSITVINTKDM